MYCYRVGSASSYQNKRRKKIYALSLNAPLAVHCLPFWDYINCCWGWTWVTTLQRINIIKTYSRWYSALMCFAPMTIGKLSLQCLGWQSISHSECSRNHGIPGSAGYYCDRDYLDETGLVSKLDISCNFWCDAVHTCTALTALGHKLLSWFLKCRRLVWTETTWWRFQTKKERLKARREQRNW